MHYLITHEGPEPIACRQSKLDYQHYIDRQLDPIADSILQFSGKSMVEFFGRIARELFCFQGGKMVLLNGFIKKSQKTPKQNLELAKTRKREVEHG